MYLIAIKSIYRFLDAGRIVVLDDGSLTAKDRRLIFRHLPSVRVTHIREVPRANTPAGGTWERLLTIADLVQDSYVIQIDSDSLTAHAIPEVLNYVAENSSFTLLGAGSFPDIEPMLEACSRAKRKGGVSMEPQAISERLLDQFPKCTEHYYVRGCSGFAGFGRGSFTRGDIERFSKNMEAICGRKKWHEWGSEQVTSNLIVANSANARVLQHPKYTSYYALPVVDYAQSSFIHFMGTHRFENVCYANLARRVIRQLSSVTNNRSDLQQGDFVLEKSERPLPPYLPPRDTSTPKGKTE